MRQLFRSCISANPKFNRFKSLCFSACTLFISKRRKNISKFINKLLGSCTADFPTKGDLKRREISPCISRVVQCIPINPKLSLGTSHKVTARVGWSDLGWAMENLWAVSMGRKIFLYVHGWATKQKPMHVYFKK
jgi:hypothetical protein